jgi:hypothetical protein
VIKHLESTARIMGITNPLHEYHAICSNANVLRRTPSVSTMILKLPQYSVR